MRWIERCLQSCVDYPIIVIDNASTDSTLNFVRKHFKEVMLIENRHNLGFGKANNLGISKALAMGAKHVFLLNQDAYLYPDTITTLLNNHIKHPTYGILSPIHLTGNGDAYDLQFLNHVNFEQELLPNNIEDLKEDKPIIDVPFVNAAGWLINKQCLETVGGFDPIFFHYGEDDNYCQRVLFHGFKIGVLRNAFIKHDRLGQPNVIYKENTKEYWVWYERRLKKIYGDVNGKGPKSLSQLFYKRIFETFGHLYHFRLKALITSIKELWVISINYREISKSFKLNSHKSKNYI